MEQMCISKEMITGHDCDKQWKPFGEATSPFRRLHLGEHEGGQGIQAHSSSSAPHTSGCSVQQGPCSPCDTHDVRLSSLIFHRMDLSVRPLVGNRYDLELPYFPLQWTTECRRPCLARDTRHVFYLVPVASGVI